MTEEKKVNSIELAVAHIENKYQSGELLWTRSNKDKVKVTEMNDYHVYHSRAILLKKPEHPIVDKWVDIFTRELALRKTKKEEDEK